MFSKMKKSMSGAFRKAKLFGKVNKAFIPKFTANEFLQGNNKNPDQLFEVNK